MTDVNLYIGPEVVAVYCDLFKPVLRKSPKPTDKPKFNITSLVTHDGVKTTEYQQLVAAVMACGVTKWGQAKFEEMLREGVFDSPFHKDIGSKGYDTALFAVRIASSANAEYPPRVLDARVRTADGKPSLVTDEREFYHGVRVRVSFATRAYGGPGTDYKAGVKLDLRNVIKMGDGPRIVLASGTDGSEFGGIAAPPPDTAAEASNMAALLG